MKILLLGKNGQVGWELQRSLSLLGEVVALGSDDSFHCGDLSKLTELAKTVHDIRPQVIVNAAAYTAVDRAESEVELAHTVNALAPQVLAREAKKIQALLIHYSTDYVFDGSGEQPWQETDLPAPLSVYGQTKLEGEQLIRNTGCQHLIFRTSWVYAARGGNFVKTILRLAKERENLSVIDDQIGAPTGADLLADVTAHAISHYQGSLKYNLEVPSGLYHLTAGGSASWHSYACFVLDEAIKAGVLLKATPEKVDAVPSSSYLTQARRPQNSLLNTSLLQNAFGLQLPNWRIGVARTLTEILEKQ